MPAEAKSAGDSLLAAGARGFFWTGGAQFVGQTLHIGIRFLLAKLLVPEDFGLLAMATVFIGVSTLIADLGLGNALVQRAEIDERHRSTLFWFTVLLSLALTAAFVVGAPLAARYFHEPRVVPVLRVLALSLVLAAPEGAYSSLLLRDLDFKTLGLRQVVGTTIAGMVGIAAAIAGFGVWALVLYALTQAAARSALLLWRSPWRPRLLWSRAALADLWGFGRWVAGARVVNYANRNADNLLVGRFLGAGPLGLYSFAYQAVLQPLLYIARPITAVSFPSFAQLQTDPERCTRAYLRTLEVTVLVAWPVAALGAVAAPSAIPLLFGSAWAPAAEIFVPLAGVAALHAFMNLASALFDGLGRPRLGFRWLLFVVLPLNLAGFAIGLRWGATGVATGLLIAAAIQVPIQSEILARFAAVPRRAQASLFTRGCLLWAAMAVGWRLASLAVDPGDGYMALAATCAAALLATLAVSLVAFRRGWSGVTEGARSLMS